MASPAERFQLLRVLRQAKKLHDEHILHPTTATPDSQLRLKQLIDNALLLAGGGSEVVKPFAVELAPVTGRELPDAIDAAIEDELKAQVEYARMAKALRVVGMDVAAGFVDAIARDQRRHEEILRGIRVQVR